MSGVDPILLSVYARTFKSITDEMSGAVERTTRSPILCEAKDFVTGLYDETGNMLEQTENLPILAFSLAPVCKHIIDYFAGDIHPGDVIFHNDVFSYGNQNNDVAVFKPIFLDGELIGWSAVKGHQADIGGAVRGGYNPNATEVWQEALRIPPVKVVDRGTLRRDVWDLIFANVRLEIVEHDMRAQMGACTVGERRLQALVGKYGADSYRTHKTALFEASRKMMAAEIAKIPDGTYSGQGKVYFDGHHDGTIFTIRVTITVAGEKITFDYSKTDPQTNGFVNGTYTSSASATILTLLQLVNPDIPHNEGMLEPVEIIIPEGTILNASYPKATTFGNHLCPPNADAIIRALAPVIPDRVTAGWNNLLCSLTTGTDPETGETYVDIGFMGLKGGSGAMKGTDGYDHIGMIDASGGVLDQDYEMFELTTPHRLVKHEYLEDSAGPGQWRGGLGVETEFIIGSEDTQLVTFGDGDFEAAFGLFGGRGSVFNSIVLNYPDGTRRKPRNKDLIKGVPKGTLYRQVAGGGGGYGDPRKRDRTKVEAELRDGIVSREAARGVYGLVLEDPEPEPEPVEESVPVAVPAAGLGTVEQAVGAPDVGTETEDKEEKDKKDTDAQDGAGDEETAETEGTDGTFDDGGDQRTDDDAGEARSVASTTDDTEETFTEGDGLDAEDAGDEVPQPVPDPDPVPLVPPPVGEDGEIKVTRVTDFFASTLPASLKRDNAGLDEYEDDDEEGDGQGPESRGGSGAGKPERTDHEAGDIGADEVGDFEFDDDDDRYDEDDDDRYDDDDDDGYDARDEDDEDDVDEEDDDGEDDEDEYDEDADEGDDEDDELADDELLDDELGADEFLMDDDDPDDDDPDRTRRS